MANYTEYYQLHQWEGSDPFLRTDFNEDFQKIDSALKEANTGPACVTGSYLGTGQDMTISLGFRPSFLAVVPTGFKTSYNTDIVGAFGFSEALTQIIRSMSSGMLTECQFTSSGFSISRCGLTTQGVTYLYAAFY